jgi:hypothetical protein
MVEMKVQMKALLKAEIMAAQSEWTKDEPRVGWTVDWRGKW